MPRTAVLVRDATPADAEALVTVWSFLLSGRHEREASPSAVMDAASAAARVAADPDQRVVVAAIDDEVVGAAHLVRAPLSPVSSEQAVHMSHLNVLESHRKQGAGRALVEAALSWAEEKDSSHVIAAASVNSRDANRFMARLGLTQVAMVRGATVAALRARMPVEPPVAARVGSRAYRNVGQVLAQRRSMRRAQSKAE
jgi:GNAT superfamily N-acetyltransferase